jgi:6-pyruvoyltetrahydropterin/6-carboxytetrahydropterin synthase
MFELVVETGFAAAHRIREYKGNCEVLHGHNWKVELRVAGADLNDLGMVCDFREVKRLLGAVVERLDHKYLNDVEPFVTINPTTENVARFVHDELKRQLPAGLSMTGVTVWESEGCGATYRED